jgi:Ser/Thr protein kinase RdoA (MazF antagonist)
VLRRVQLEDGSLRRAVIAKTRTGSVGGPAGVPAGRPTLLPDGAAPLSDPARREYEGLRLIADMLQDQRDGRFGVVRPLAWLPGSGSIVMDHVSSPTLRDLLVASSRLTRPFRRCTVAVHPFERVGAWLRILHDRDCDLPLADRGASRDHLVQLCSMYEAYLRRRAGAPRSTAALAGAAARALADTLPQSPRLVTGHGDFAARNVFCDPTGRISVFDPLPRWRVPVFEDLCRFIVGVRLLGVQALTRGLALRASDVDDIEAAVISGYFAGAAVPARAVHAFTALVLMDKWTAMADKAERGLLGHGRAALSRGYYAAEADRLTALLTRPVAEDVRG